MGEDTPEISGLKGSLVKKEAPKAPETPSPSRLRGTLLEKKEQIENPDIVVEATLNSEKDEDGPPVARSLMVDRNTSNLRGSLAPKNTTKIGFVAVADGLGGSGSRHVMVEVDGKKEKRSMAYVASRKAQDAAINVVDKNPQALTGTMEEIRATLQAALQESYSTIRSEAPTSRIKGSIVKDFPTTFSTAIVQETNEGKKVILFWAGDSPLFVFTPDKILTTHTPGAGDAPVDSLITPGNYNLNARQFDFPSDTPLLIAAASDGVLKLGIKDLEYAKDFIIEGVQNNNPAEIGDKLRDEYQRRKGLGYVERDDTTIAMVSSMKPGEMTKLTASAPTQTVS